LDFTAVYEDHVWDVYAFLAYRLNSRSDAEDLTQLTFERAFRSWDKYDSSKASVRTWLLAIARNALIDHLRRQPQRAEESLDEIQLADRLTRQEAPAADFGVAPELQRGLESLTDREREVVALRFGGDLRGSEVASMLGLTLANVQQISSRALRKLRDALEPVRAGQPEADRSQGSGTEQA
jgi:RNA polymerase sigma-70 factor (ECF subfamily)